MVNGRNYVESSVIKDDAKVTGDVKIYHSVIKQNAQVSGTDYIIVGAIFGKNACIRSIYDFITIGPFHDFSTSATEKICTGNYTFYRNFKRTKIYALSDVKVVDIHPMTYKKYKKILDSLNKDEKPELYKFYTDMCKLFKFAEKVLNLPIDQRKFM